MYSVVFGVSRGLNRCSVLEKYDVGITKSFADVLLLYFAEHNVSIVSENAL